MQVEDCNM